jgi:uncharacterized protein (TIGR02145 family)
MLNDNISIPYIADDNTWFNLTTMGYCWYDNQSSYKDIYGALYNWYTVNSGRLCPSGWHIPADYEWTELVTFVGGGRYSESVENANKLKETGYEHWDISCPEGTNISGFSARPGGIRFGYYYSDNKCFETLHNTAWWWTVTVMSNDRRWCYFVFCNGLQGTNYLRTCGMSVRCLKD